MHMHVAFTLICNAEKMDGGYSFEKIEKLLELRTAAEPAFRRKLMNVPFNLDHPLWVEADDFSIKNHVRHDQVEAPYDFQCLGDVIGRLMSQQIDRSHPLWEAWVIDGIQGNRFALVLKIHHAAVDGVSGSALIKRLFDGFAAEADVAIPADFSDFASDGPTRWDLLKEAVKVRAQEPQRMAKLLKQSVNNLSDVVKKRGQVDSNVKRSAPYSAPQTHFNRHIGPQRGVSLVHVSLDDIKQVKNAAGCTVNDVVLALCGGVLRDYLLRQDDLPQKSLTAMVPISVRTEEKKSAVNNQVSGMWSTLATHVSDPLERLRLIQADTAGAKEEMNAVGANLLQDWAEFGRPGTLALAMKLVVSSGLLDRMAPVHNTIISNLPGPRDPYFFGGAQIEGLYPIGPCMEGVGLNISLSSYMDRVCFAIQVDTDLVNSSHVIADLFALQMDALKKAVEPRSTESRFSMTDLLPGKPLGLYPA